MILHLRVFVVLCVRVSDVVRERKRERERERSWQGKGNRATGGVGKQGRFRDTGRGRTDGMG